MPISLTLVSDFSINFIIVNAAQHTKALEDDNPAQGGMLPFIRISTPKSIDVSKCSVIPLNPQRK